MPEPNYPTCIRRRPRLTPLLAAAGICLLPALPAIAQDSTEVTMTSADGNEIGMATLTPTPAGLLIRLEFSDLEPGAWHGFHIHENGACDPEDGFESAGGHFAPEGNSHGFLVEDGPHAGDMPNQYVAADGTLKAEVVNPRAVLGDGGDTMTGRALILHAGPDDYESQPSGDAGDRLACGLIE